MMGNCTVIEVAGGHFGWLWWPCTLMQRMLHTTGVFFQRNLAETGLGASLPPLPGDFGGAWVRGEPVAEGGGSAESGGRFGDPRAGFLWQHRALSARM